MLFLLIALIYVEHVISLHVKFVCIIFLLFVVIILFACLITTKRRAMRRFVNKAQKEQADQKRIYVALSSSQYADANDLTASAVPPQQVQDVLESENESLMLLGLPGAGKTISLQVHQYEALQHASEIMQGKSRIPIVILMKDYNDFLNNYDEVPEPLTSFSELEQLPLLSYLSTGTLPGTEHTRRYMKKWMEKGRLLLLCDGLNEINASYQPLVCAELLYIMQSSNNQVVMTCRELDYNDPQKMFRRLVGDGLARGQIVRPLHSDMIEEFISKYIEASRSSGEVSRYSVEQLLDLIDRTRLRYECTNPLMLATLIEVINNNAQLTSSQIDTRGKLLRACIASLIERELAKDMWQSSSFESRDIILLCSQVAYIARRRSKDSRNALPLGAGNAKKKDPMRGLANELDRLLADPRGPDSTISSQDYVWKEPFARPVLKKMLEFAQQANIITFSSGYLLSFRHELIAEYFVAEYLDIAYEKLNRRELPFGVALIQDVSDWKEPIRNWAGLVEDQVLLADHLAWLGLQNLDYAFNALTLSLLCVGTRLGTVEEQAKTPFGLPKYTKDLFQHVNTLEKQTRLAKTIDECAQEGGIAVYRAFLPLLHARNFDKIILKLDSERVPEVLFEHLSELIEKNAQMNTLPDVIAILGKFGNASLQLAIKHSQTPAHQPRLRTAAIEVLGRTGEQAAVAPLMLLLSEITNISDSARDALIRLGPDFVLPALLNRLANHIPDSKNGQVHYALLEIIEHFLAQKWHGLLVKTTYYQTIITALLPVLFEPYTEPVQQLANNLLLQQAQTQMPERNQVIEKLILQLSTRDSTRINGILSDKNTISTPLLLRYLRQSSSEIHRERIVEVLRLKHDPDALPALIDLIITPWQNLRKQVAKTLVALQPESIPELIAVMLHNDYEEAIEAQKILQDIGRPCVVEVCNSLNPIVPERSQFLVQVLAHIRDNYAIPSLTLLLSNTLHDEDLAITTIQALREFPDSRVVAALIEVLEYTNKAVYDETSKALSQLGMIALLPLVNALNVDKETHAIRGILNALTYIKSDSYPYPSLLQAVVQASEAQEQRIMKVFLARSVDVAPFLVNRLCFPDERVRSFVRQTLDKMDLEDSIAALLHAVDKTNCHEAVSSRLYKYRQVTIPKLVAQLEDPHYGKGSAVMLVDFGPEVIPHLLTGLGSKVEQAYELAQWTIVEVAKQHPAVLPDIISLFRRASDHPDKNKIYQSLISVLAEPLAELSVPHLLEGLASYHHSLVRAGVKDALVRLVSLGNEQSRQALEGLIHSLQNGDLRDEAKQALVQIGDPAIPGVNALSEHRNPTVREVAISIISKLPGALPAIYENMKGDVPRREFGLSAFRQMDTASIQKSLIAQLISDDLHKISIAITLLLQRLIDDLDTPDTNKLILPVLLEQLQHHERDNEAMHIVIFLLLLPKGLLLEQARNMLFRNPVSQEWLTPFVLLLNMRGIEVKNLLGERYFDDANMTSRLRAQIAGLLGMIDESGNSPATGRAMSINQLMEKSGGQISSEELMVAQHALGGLLVSDRWNQDRLRQFRQMFLPETHQHELYSILLGESYVPVIKNLRDKLTVEQQRVKEGEQIMANLRETLSSKQRELEKAQSQRDQERWRADSLDSKNDQLTSANKDLETQLRLASQRIRELERVFQQLTSPHRRG